MGAFDTIPNIMIPDDSDPIAAAAFRRRHRWEAHEMVILRPMFTAGDQEAVVNASTHTDKKGTPSLVAGTGRIALLHRMIVDWTFSVNGRKVGITPEAIKRLPANYSNPLLERCDELAQAMTEEEQTDFFGSVNGHSWESSVEANGLPLLS
jgi:hypothetical protein